MKYINIRGTNGSGKTTLLRQLVERSPEDKREVVLIEVTDHKPIPVTYLYDQEVAILGDYLPSTATTAGCDRIKTQAAIKEALEKVGDDPNLKWILFEGVVVATIFGPWLKWSRDNGGMVWAYLETPLKECLRRIQERNGGKPVKEDQVADKVRSICTTRRKAIEAGEAVVELGDVPLAGLLSAMEVYGAL